MYIQTNNISRENKLPCLLLHLDDQTRSLLIYDENGDAENELIQIKEQLNDLYRKTEATPLMQKSAFNVRTQRDNETATL
jgi:gag-polyprotein putative aspartyl protease